jgi:MYXO-CTERM domain-containing protein
MKIHHSIHASLSDKGKSVVAALLRPGIVVIALVGCVHLISSAALAAPISISNVTSDVPSFITVNGGSTDPAATVDGNKSSNPGGFVDWANDGAAGFLIATFTYEFASKENVFAFELWNDRGQIDTGIENFELVFYDSIASVLDTYSGTASLPTSTSATPQGEYFDFATVIDVKTVDLRVLSSFGVQANQFREVEFSGTPEPSGLLLALLGLALLPLFRRRQSR